MALDLMIVFQKMQIIAYNKRFRKAKKVNQYLKKKKDLLVHILKDKSTSFQGKENIQSHIGISKMLPHQLKIKSLKTINPQF